MKNALFDFIEKIISDMRSETRRKDLFSACDDKLNAIPQVSGQHRALPAHRVYVLLL